MKKPIIGCTALALLFSAMSYAVGQPPRPATLKTYPVDTMQGIQSNIKNLQIDSKVSSDKKASLKINATEPLVINLYNTGDLNVDDAKLLYSANIKTENFKGVAYLEMWCNFDGKGRFFSRDLATPIKGNTNGWVTEETPFLLQKGQNPDNVELNLVINGTGTVWIDDIKLLKAPLK